MAHDFANPGHYVDLLGRLWYGPTHPEENLHWSRHEGIQGDGSACWVLQRSERPTDTEFVEDSDAEELVRVWTRELSYPLRDYVNFCQKAKDASECLDSIWPNLNIEGWDTAVAHSAILAVLLGK